ncbi:hypothetical protein GCM10009765_06520 [Fodinicola feengrottensis]|uniref:Putative restriction endonuclease domain-containing protein n=1 Tax=Fodinicola feengrottensis TaxID=435914 RepID=A0ABN2FUD5_9ACTN
MDLPLTHRWAVTAIEDALQLHRPSDAYVFQSTAVHLADTTVIPDLLVVQEETPFHGDAYDAGGVLLVVEVGQASSAVYADSGVPSYWRIDPDLTLSCFHLRDGSYELATAAGLGEHLTVDFPWPISFAVDHLRLP